MNNIQLVKDIYQESRFIRSLVKISSVFLIIVIAFGLYGMVFGPVKDSEYVRNAKERAGQIALADLVEASGSALQAKGVGLVKQALQMKDWADSCRAANSGTGSAVDCSLIPVNDAESAAGTGTNEKNEEATS